jgi:hypothetical protein
MGFLLDTFLLFCLQALGVCTQASVEIGYHCLKFGYATLTHSKLHALMQRYFRISHSLETSEFEVYLCQCIPAIDRNHWQLHLGSRSEWSTIHISSITLELSLSTTFFSQFPSHGTSLGGVQVVLELCSDGTVVTSDQPPTVLGSLPSDFLQQVLPQHCVFADSIYDCSHVLTHLIRENLRLEYCCSFFANLFH